MYGEAHRRRRHGFRIRERERGRAGPHRPRLVTSAEATPRKRGIARRSPASSITVRRTALTRRPLGRRELNDFTRWNDGQPETELNFKFYRQATNKVVGISAEAMAFRVDQFSRPGARGLPTGNGPLAADLLGVPFRSIAPLRRLPHRLGRLCGLRQTPNAHVS